MSMELEAFLSRLISDTENNIIFWSVVGDWGSGDYFSIDFRDINVPLCTWTDRNPFLFSSWQDVYITNIMSGFVFLAKTNNLPPKYYLYIQPDADSNINLISCNSASVKKVYDEVTSHLSTSYDPVSDFVYLYLNQNSLTDDD